MKSPHRIARYAVAALVVFALVPSAFAAKGGGGGNGSQPSLTLVVLGSTTAAASAQPQWGQQVTFDVVTGASWASVQVECVQNGSLVYRQTNPYPFGTATFTLSGYWWTGGAADCTAALLTLGNNNRWTTVATTGFHVAA